jgi:phenylalanyl-tRNA synthetase beta chain
MTISIPDSWLREHLRTSANPEQIKNYLSLCGPSVERVSKVGDDFVYDIEITSNRPDAASVLGIAREAMAILPRFGKKAKLDTSTIKPLNHLTISPGQELPLRVQINDPSLCPRFTAVILDNITIKPSPQFAQDRLNKSGIRSINNVVDISNYLMMLFGQPVHTFDYDKIQKATMILRESKSGEKITTLDGKTFTLNDHDIVIEDGAERLIDLCGIMGGENSAVDSKTRRVLLFVQTYDPYRIRKTSMRLGQRTPAATLFEKNLDSENVLPVVFYGIDLFAKWAGAKPASKITDIYPKPTKSKAVNIKTDFINQRLGVNLAADEIVEILESLSFTVTRNDKLLVTPPSFRQFDITIPEDIIEEVARIYGYHRLPTKLPAGDIPITDKPKYLSLESKVKTMLKYWGFTEMYNYSFISKKLIEKANLEIASHLKVANPLTSETEYMRRSLIPAVLENVEHNQHLKDDLALFELSKVYLPRLNDLPDEKSELVIICQSDFFKLKGIVTALFTELGISKFTQVVSDDWEFGHPKQTLFFKKDKGIIAKLASLHPQLVNNFHLKNKLFIAEIDFDELVAYFQPVKKYHPIPSFPPVIEDLTLTITTDIKIGLLIEELEKIDPLINHAELLDKYKDAITVRITYQDLQRNLTGDDVKKVREKVLSVLNNKFSLRLKQTSP